jgi:hypothetical protein
MGWMYKCEGCHKLLGPYYDDPGCCPECGEDKSCLNKCDSCKGTFFSSNDLKKCILCNSSSGIGLIHKEESMNLYIYTYATKINSADSRYAVVGSLFTVQASKDSAARDTAIAHCLAAGYFSAEDLEEERAFVFVRPF